jgi:hypothetical protein
VAALQPAAATVCLEPAAQGGHEKEADMRRTQLITTAALVAACAAPAAPAAQGQDLRSPDTRDAAAAAAAAQQHYQDLRSPDTRDAARASETRQYSDLRSPDARDAGRTADTRVTQDLRSPDARDAGRPPVQVPTSVMEIREVPGNGFDWGDAGIGAAGLLALLSITGGVTLMVLGRRRRRGAEVPAH